MPVWEKMASATLILVQIFNRRRSGEVERILTDDFNTYQKFDIEKDSMLFNFTAEKFSENPQKYVRFVIRGKKQDEFQCYFQQRC